MESELTPQESEWKIGAIDATYYRMWLTSRGGIQVDVKVTPLTNPDDLVTMRTMLLDEVQQFAEQLQEMTRKPTRGQK